MTESEVVDALVQACKELSGRSAIGHDGGLPKVFGNLGTVVESQQRQIRELQSRVKKLEE